MPYSSWPFLGTDKFSPLQRSIYVQTFEEQGDFPPPTTKFMITENGNFMVTESGEKMITE